MEAINDEKTDQHVAAGESLARPPGRAPVVALGAILGPLLIASVLQPGVA